MKYKIVITEISRQELIAVTDETNIDDLIYNSDESLIERNLLLLLDKQSKNDAFTILQNATSIDLDLDANSIQ